MKTLFLLFVALLAFSCRQSGETQEEREQRLADSLALVDANNNGIADSLERVDLDSSPDANAYAEFTTSDGSTNIRLREPRSRINMSALGTPIDTLTRELTLASDTHQGSTVTEYKYENINLVYFTPKGSNDPWLMTVEIKGGPWATARGIKVGDSVADLKNMYPKIADWNDTKQEYQHVYSLDDSVLLFGVTGDKVTRIKIEYNIP